MLEATPATVTRPYGDEDGADDDLSWLPTPVERTPTQRPVRWSIVFAAIAMAAAALIGVQLLVTIPQERADSRRAEYEEALTDFSRALDEINAATAPSSPEELASFAAGAAALRAVAEEDLPRVIPLLPVGPIEGLRPARSAMLGLADQADAFVADLESAAEYRLAARSILAIPLLPTEAPLELMDAAARAVNDMTRETRRQLEALEPDPRFVGYRDRVEDALAAMPAWTDRYLLALRREDVASATELVAELQGRALLATVEMENAVAGLDEAAASALSELESSLEEVRREVAAP
jgi:hypothetical protein